MVVPTGEVVTKFMGQQNRQQRDREGQPGEEQGRVVISERKGFKESVQRDRLVVGIGGGKMRPGQETGKQC